VNAEYLSAIQAIAAAAAHGSRSGPVYFEFHGSRAWLILEREIEFRVGHEGNKQGKRSSSPGGILRHD